MISVNRKLKFFIVPFICALLLVAASTVFLLRSEAVSRFLITRLSDRACGSLKIGECRGNLLNGITLRSVNFTVDEQNIDVDSAMFEFCLLPLFKGAVHFREIKLSRVDYRVAGSPITALNGILPLLESCLPKYRFVIEKMTLTDMVFNADDFHQAITRIALNLSLDGTSVDVARMIIDKSNLSIMIQAAGELRAPYSFNADVRWALDQSVGEPFKGAGNLQGDHASIKIEHELYAPLYLVTSGEIKPKWLSNGNCQIISEGDLSGYNVPNMHILVSGEGNFQDFNVDTLEIQSLGGKINAHGRVLWHSAPEWDFALSGMNIDPGHHWPLWRGELDFGFKTKGHIANKRPIATVNDLTISGQLLDQPFDSSGDMQINGEEITIQDMQVYSGKNSFKIDGIASDQSDLRIGFDLQEPAKLWTGIHGHIQGETRLEGDRRKPIGVVSLNGNDLRYGEYRLKTVDINATLDMCETSRSKGQVQLHGLSAGEQYFNDMSLNWNGDFDNNQLDLDVASPTTRMKLDMNGSCAKDVCRLKIGTASFAIDDNGTWQSARPIHLEIEPDSIQSFDSCWIRKDEEKCLNSSWSEEDGWRLEGDEDSTPLKDLIGILKDVFDRKHLGWDQKK